jgi:amino acid adenylation domain-containing protein
LIAMSIGTPARDAALAVDYDPFADGTLSRVVPSTEPQREIWLADQLGAEASLAYNESVSLHLRGVLDAAALHAALQSLLDRHDALRASFGPDGEALCIREQVSFELPLLDLSAADPARREQAVAERRAAVVETPFALGRDHLLRGELLRLAHDEHVLILTAHHIVCDGWSWWVLVRELGTLYAQRLGHAVEALPPAEAFADYALAQACQPDAAYAQDEQYWLARFAGEIPVLDLPTDRPRPARRSFGSAREDWTLDAELVAAIRRLGARQGASLFATLLGSFAALLIRLAHQSRVVIGIPTAGQAIDGHDALVGHCVNTLPLLFEPDLDRPAALAIEQAQTTLLDALEHQRLTFGSLLRKLRIGRDPSRLPLVSVMFNIDQALDHEDSAFPGLQLEFASNPRRYENFELAINAVQSHGELRLECQYNRELFDGATIRQWLGHYQTLLQAMAADDDTAFGRLPLLADIEQRKVLEKFNATHVDYPAGQCIHELIEAQVARTPQAIAVSHEGATLSYAGLNERANRLAHHLRASGVRPDQRVAICAERSLELVVGLLAILKAGAAYVPLDPEYPPERLAWMLQDCAPAMLLTQQALVPRLAPLAPAVPPLALDQAAPAWAECEASNPLAAANGLHDRHLAYVIYTSGSTGLPKGAMNEHRGVVNRLRWMQEMFAVDARDVVLQKTPCSFDVSVWEFFLPLMSGARLVMARAGGHRDPAYLADTIRREQVSTIHFVPSMLHAFLDHGDTAACASLKQVICSGEALPAVLAAAFFRQLPGVGLHNLYGPTEAAVDVTAWACVAGDDASSIPIGRPVANTRIYILDGYGQPVPVGVAGEIFIGGVQVGRGYLNRETLTAERFLPDPFAHDADARMYKTGDLGRWRADGNIEYLGRNDFQVKLRGFRIELGEIEHRLATHPAVAQAVVLAREDRPGDMRLVAYIAGAAGASADPAALSAHLRASLPEYMVPAHYVMLPAIPLSPNGKVDRTRLPAPDTAAGSGAREQQAPRDELEQRVAAAMAATLGVDAPGVDDNFFDLGGHSLLASRWIARLNRELGLTLSLRAAFDAPSVAAMAAAIRALGADPAQARPAPPSIPRLADRDTAPLSLMQQRVWYLEQLNPGQVVYHAPSAHRLRGPMNVAAFEQALRDMVRRQPTLRTAIELDDKTAVQRIHAELEIALPLEDLSGVDAAGREAVLARRLEELIAEPFDLGTPPLFRVRLFRLAADEHVFFFMPHHVIWDGWSFDLLYEEMSALYAARAAGREPALPPLAVEYADFAAWHAQWMRGDELKRQLAHWRKRLAGTLEPLALPVDRPRPPRMSGAGATEWIHLPADQAAGMRQLGQQGQGTLFMVLLTAWCVLLHRLSGQGEVIVNTPVRGRDTPELERVMGFFVNALPLRVQLEDGASFLDALQAVRGVVLDAFACADVPFEQLVIDLDLRRDDSRPPLSQAMFSFQDVRLRPGRWGELEHQNIPVFQHGAADDVGLWFIEHAQGLSGGLTYNTDIFDAASVARWIDYLRQILAQAVASPQRALGDIELMDAAERTQVLVEWNATAVDYDRTLGLPALIEAQMRAAPQRIAAECGGERVDYAWLDQASRNLALALGRHGLGRGDRVGICVPRSLSMLVAVLGVLRSGAAYVPLDPTFPPDRLHYMAEHAQLRHVLVTDAALLPAAVAEGRELLDVDALAAQPAGEGNLPPVHGDDTAYVLYTSGSTGKPKGVAVLHRNLVNFLLAMAREPGFTRDDTVCAATTLSFDIAGLELYLPLTVGGRVVIATDEEQHDPNRMWDLIERSGCNVLQVTPSVLRLLQDAGRDRALDQLRLFVGGEALPSALARNMAGRCRELWNLYGPTETTIWSSLARIRPDLDTVPLGKPIANTRIYVLDAQGRPLPPGVIGEIWIGGDGVAAGYLFQPELTAERFVDDPFVGGTARMYRSGDLGAWRHGVLHFHGRVDHQVKLRGFRIELGDIEAAADSHPAVHESVAAVRRFGDNDLRMVLYVVMDGDVEAGARELREHLRQRLPGYMLPQHIETLAQLPKTPNGKIDRKQLPEPVAAAVVAQQRPGRQAEPATDAMSDARELYLAGLWRELIGVEEIRRNDNFLDLGGHSMLAVEFASRVRKETGVSLRLLNVVTGTLASLAAELPEAGAGSPRPAEGSLWSRLRKRLGGG